MACSCPDSTYTKTLSDLSNACVSGACTWGSSTYSKILKSYKTMTCTKDGVGTTSACEINAGCCS
jgi:hypothetical protein